MVASFPGDCGLYEGSCPTHGYLLLGIPHGSRSPDASGHRARNCVGRRFTSSKDVDERHTQLGSALQSFQSLIVLENDANQWEGMREPLRSAQRAYDRGFAYFKAEQFKEAEEQLLQGESDIRQLEAVFSAMPSDFLQGELNARLQSARTRLGTIKSQAETEHLRYKQLEEIADEIADMETIVLGDPNLSYAAVARKVTPLQRIFSDLEDVQNALRFHRNLDASVNQLRRDLSDKQLIIRIGKELGLDTTRTEQAESKMAEGLKVFQPGSSDSPENTVNAFRTARDFLSELNTAANALGETIGVQWYVRRTQDAAIETYIPKRCSTKEPVTGLVVFHPGVSLIPPGSRSTERSSICSRRPPSSWCRQIGSRRCERLSSPESAGEGRRCGCRLRGIRNRRCFGLM